MGKLDFNGRVALVTGGGRGLGRSHARMLASRGARVVVNDLTPEPGEEDAAADVVREIIAEGGQAVAAHGDVVGGAPLVQAAIDAYGQLDIVVCNAGISATATFLGVSDEAWYDLFDIHFRGTADVLRAAWPHLVRSGSGRIITTSSSGMLGNVGSTNYGAAKAAIFSLTRSLALEGAAAGINANCILPSARTRLSDPIDNADIIATLDKYFSVEHVSSLVVWLCHQDTKVSNETFQVNGRRAGRITVAAGPTVTVSESTPEVWVQNERALLAPGPLKDLPSLGVLFVDAMAGANPDIGKSMTADGGLPLKLEDEGA